MQIWVVTICKESWNSELSVVGGIFHSEAKEQNESEVNCIAIKIVPRIEANPFHAQTQFGESEQWRNRGTGNLCYRSHCFHSLANLKCQTKIIIISIRCCFVPCEQFFWERVVPNGTGTSENKRWVQAKQQTQ